jgi:hypothetical protein
MASSPDKRPARLFRRNYSDKCVQLLQDLKRACEITRLIEALACYIVLRTPFWSGKDSH